MTVSGSYARFALCFSARQDPFYWMVALRMPTLYLLFDFAGKCSTVTAATSC